MPQRIVVIDDTPYIVQFYEDLLTEEGYDVVGTFASPPDDPHLIEAVHPDVIILDWIFGKEAAGMRVLETLKAHAPTAGIPIIVCTVAQQAIAEVEDILPQRGVRVLHKPFAVDDLLTMIQQAVAPKPVSV
jgi:DNA-binding response OmpR family regulator